MWKKIFIPLYFIVVMFFGFFMLLGNISEKTLTKIRDWYWGDDYESDGGCYYGGC